MMFIDEAAPIREKGKTIKCLDKDLTLGTSA